MKNEIPDIAKLEDEKNPIKLLNLLKEGIQLSAKYKLFHENITGNLTNYRIDKSANLSRSTCHVGELIDILRLIPFDTHRRRGVMALPHGMWERDISIAIIVIPRLFGFFVWNIFCTGRFEYD
ncbi:hypothetical protein QUF50_01420 [Thiotrichales bacterium HSG1]|nr:hypothetical protein [Thiotrichales bacterium HSG1]